MELRPPYGNDGALMSRAVPHPRIPDALASPAPSLLRLRPPTLSQRRSHPCHVFIQPLLARLADEQMLFDRGGGGFGQSVHGVGFEFVVGGMAHVHAAVKYAPLRAGRQALKADWRVLGTYGSPNTVARMVGDPTY